MAQLYFYYSAMNAGKSTALLQSSYNYQERGMRAVVYTAEIDDRFGAGKVSSRIGLSSPAKLFNQNSSLFEEIRAENAQQRIHCVLVDESQFLTRQQVYELSEVVDQLDIPVLCYGLRTDFRGELFGAFTCSGDRPDISSITLADFSGDFLWLCRVLSGT